jgi:hypothetical protein
MVLDQTFKERSRLSRIEAVLDSTQPALQVDSSLYVARLVDLLPEKGASTLQIITDVRDEPFSVFRMFSRNGTFGGGNRGCLLWIGAVLRLSRFWASTGGSCLTNAPASLSDSCSDVLTRWRDACAEVAISSL